MYRKLTAAVAITFASLAAAPAFATGALTPASGEASAPPRALSTTTRAQVKQELLATRAGMPLTVSAGEAWGGQEPPAALGGVAVTRKQVKQEFRASRSSPVASDGWRYAGGEAGWRFGG